MNLKNLSYVFFALVLVVLFTSCSSGPGKEITAFSINGVEGTISGTDIALTLPIGSEVTSLTPTITVSEGASVIPASGVAQDFTQPVTYTVVAKDATTKEYIVTVTASTRAAGTKVTFTADSVSFKMAYVPGGLSFPVGIMDVTDPETTVSRGYWIGETEVTYELWDKVHTWAIANGYTFANAGQAGSSGTGAVTEPVTTISWRDAIIFSNALTEWYNAKAGTSYTCVYYANSTYTTPIRTSTSNPVPFPLVPGGEDDPYIKNDATGFRLLTSDEWELAAKYKDGTNWTPGNYASGATDYAADWDGNPNPDETATEAVAWYNPLGTTTGTDVVKGTRTANALGLYDMSGNVWEWSDSWYSGPWRVVRGGGWCYDAFYMQIGFVDADDPYSTKDFIGFRLSRTDL